MPLKRTLVAVLGMYSLLMLSSCGGSPGGGVAEFKTVSVSASASTTSLESDVLTGNTCAGSVLLTDGTFVTDTVDVTITSTLYPGLASGLPVAIDSYTVQYIPINSLPSTEPPPPLAGLSVSGTNLGKTVQPGGSLTFPAEVGSQALKSILLNGNIPACSGKIHAYYVIITMSGVEVGTGTRNNIGPISLNVAFADRI